MRGNRGEGVALPPQRDGVGLPARVFLYTLDQIAVMLDLSQTRVEQTYIYFEGRSTGARQRALMLAHNIAPPDERPDWRVSERELIRWMKVKGFKYYDRGVFQ